MRLFIAARRPAIWAGLAFLLVVLAGGAGAYLAFASEAAFVQATTGCPGAHCDAQMSDIMNNVAVPEGAVRDRWHVTPDRWFHTLGSRRGIGCSSNGSILACSFYYAERKKGAFVRVYDGDGSLLWDTKKLSEMAFASAPLISPTGEVIAADDTTIIRFNSGGSIDWQTTVDATATSPVLTESGILIAATLEGPIFALDSASGQIRAQLSLADWNTESGLWATTNTPAVRGERFYLPMEFHGTVAETPGRLYAIDVVESGGTYDLVPAWFFEYKAESGASPLVIDDMVFVDGDGDDPYAEAENPTLFALRDDDAAYTLAWQLPLASDMRSSPARDPRGGLWFLTAASPWLYRVSETGQMLQTINVNQLVGEAGDHVPSSGMSIATDAAGQPVMLFSAAALDISAYVVALNLETESLLWKVYLGDRPRDIAFGQFPIVLDGNGNPVVAFSTYGNGVWGMGVP